MDHQQAREHTSVVIRPYGRSDAAEALAAFISAVTETASADYTAEQVQAWAQPERRASRLWRRSACQIPCLHFATKPQHQT